MANIFRPLLIGLPRPRSQPRVESSGQPLTVTDQGAPIGQTADRLPVLKADGRVSRWPPSGSPLALLREPSWSIYANPAQNPTITTILAYFLDAPGHAAAASRVKAAGAAHFFENLDWSSLEATTGNFTDTLIDRTAANASPLPLWLNIATINTDGTRRVPSDLASTAWDDPTMIAAFNGFLDHLQTRVGSALQHLYVGNEVDNYFATHATEISAYATFLAAVRTHARTLWDVNTLQVGVTFTEAAVSHFSDFAAILAAEDIAPFTYYFLSGNSFQTDVAAIKTAIGDKPWSFQEIGFTSDVATWGSSQATQNALVSGAFAVLAPEPRFVGATWFQLSDYSDAVLTNAGYTAPLLSFYTQIGLRDTGDRPKTGWPTIVALLGGVAGELPDGLVIQMGLPPVRLRADRQLAHTSLLTTVLAPATATPIIPKDWPLPRLKARTLTPLSYRPASATPTARVPFPFAAVFDNPVLAKYPTTIRGSVHPYDAYLVPAVVGVQPFTSTDFPNPIPKRPAVDLRTWLQTPPSLSGSNAVPFVTGEFANPRGRGFALENRTYLDPVDLALLSQDKFFGGNGQPPTYQPPPNPLIARPVIDGRFGQQPNAILPILNTVTQPPFLNFTQPNPTGPRYPLANRTWLGYIIGDESVPFSVTDWPNPRRAVAAVENRTWLQAFDVQLSSADVLPFRLTDHPNPLIAKRSIDLRTHTEPFDVLLAGKDALPFFLTEQPVPRGYRYPLDLRTWIGMPPNTSGFVPFVPLAFPNPSIAGRALDLRTLTHAHLPILFVAPVFAGSVLGPVQRHSDNPAPVRRQVLFNPENVALFAQSGPTVYVRRPRNRRTGARGDAMADVYR